MNGWIWWSSRNSIYEFGFQCNLRYTVSLTPGASVHSTNFRTEPMKGRYTRTRSPKGKRCTVLTTRRRIPTHTEAILLCPFLDFRHRLGPLFHPFSVISFLLFLHPLLLFQVLPFTFLEFIFQLKVKKDSSLYICRSTPKPLGTSGSRSANL